MTCPFGTEDGIIKLLITLVAIGTLLLFVRAGHSLQPLSDTQKTVKTGSPTGQENKPDPKAQLDLKMDARLKAPITADFKKPNVSELLEVLKKATGLKFTANDKTELGDVAFGSLSFRNTPAWVIMGELAKSKSVKGTWEKTEEGYKLIGTLDRTAQVRQPPEIVKSPEVAKVPEQSSSHMALWVAIGVIVLTLSAYVIHWFRRNSTHSF